MGHLIILTLRTHLILTIITLLLLIIIPLIIVLRDFIILLIILLLLLTLTLRAWGHCQSNGALQKHKRAELLVPACSLPTRLRGGQQIS